MAEVAGVGVARDRAGGGWGSLIFIALPYSVDYPSSRHKCNDNRSSPDLFNLIGRTLTEHVSHGRSDFGANGQVDTNCPYCSPHNLII
jgi:hypothetical protein